MPALTDKQKADLKKHIDKVGGTPAEKKSHRMKMISRMSRGMSLAKAHKDIQEGQKKEKKAIKKFVKKNEGKKYLSNPTPKRLLLEAAEELGLRKSGPLKGRSGTSIHADDTKENFEFKSGKKVINPAQRNELLELTRIKSKASMLSKGSEPGRISKKGFNEKYLESRLVDAWKSYKGLDRGFGALRVITPQPDVKLTVGQPDKGGLTIYQPLTQRERELPAGEEGAKAPRFSAPGGASSRFGAASGITATRPESAASTDTYTRGIIVDGRVVPPREVREFYEHLAKYGSADKALSLHARAHIAGEA